MEDSERYDRLEERSDMSLLKDMSYGNKDALKEMLRRYLDLVSRTAFRILCDREDSENVTVRVFVSLWNDVLEYDDRLTVEEWILRKTCIYCRLRIMRRRILRLFGVVNDVFVKVPPSSADADDYLTKQAWQLHCRCVTHMTPLQSAVYALCVLESVSEQQMADISGLPEFRITRALERAEEKVRSELNDYGKADQYDSYNGFLRRVAEGMSDMDKLNKMIIFAV